MRRKKWESRLLIAELSQALGGTTPPQQTKKTKPKAKPSGKYNWVDTATMIGML